MTIVAEREVADSLGTLSVVELYDRDLMRELEGFYKLRSSKKERGILVVEEDGLPDVYRTSFVFPDNSHNSYAGTRLIQMLQRRNCELLDEPEPNIDPNDLSGVFYFRKIR